MNAQACEVIESINALSHEIHAMAVEKGWWIEERNDGEIIALCHSELSEALEAMRDGNPPSEKIPHFSQVEEELADTIIRILDYCGEKGYRIGEAIAAKFVYNADRPYRHGRKF